MKKWNWVMASAGFKDGKLYLGNTEQDIYQPTQSTDRILIVRASDLRRWSMVNTPNGIKFHGTKKKLPLKRILGYSKAEIRDDRNKKPYTKFIEAVGRDNIKLAIRCRQNETQILQRILVIPGYKELLKRTPILAKDMAQYPLNKCRAMIKYNERQLAGVLVVLSQIKLTFGKPSTIPTIPTLRKSKKTSKPVSKAQLKALRKVHINTPESITYILSAWESCRSKYKYHLNKLSTSMLDLLNQADICSYPISFDIVRQAEREVNKLNKKGSRVEKVSRFANYLQDIKRLTKAISNREAKPISGRINKLEDIQELHDKLTEQLHKLEDKKVQFPEPPAKGNEYITPITDSHMLHKEGTEMHHCCYSYSNSVLGGLCYIYSVKVDDLRATLEVRSGSNGLLRRVQLQAACNQYPDEKLEHEVDKWLAAKNLKRREKAFGLQKAS